LPVLPEQLREMRRVLPVTAQMHRKSAKDRTVMLERYKMELESKFGQEFSQDMIDPGYV